jgi:hypothetical protein
LLERLHRLEGVFGWSSNTLSHNMSHRTRLIFVLDDRSAFQFPIMPATASHFQIPQALWLVVNFCFLDFCHPSFDWFYSSSSSSSPTDPLGLWLSASKHSSTSKYLDQQ